MMRFPGALALAAGLLLCCGGGGSKPADVVVPAPTQLVVSLYNPDAFTLQWAPPGGSIDGYDLEGRIDAAAFKQLNTDLMSPSNTAGVLTLKDTAPDLATYTFRIRAVRGGVFSAYSNEASCLRPLKAPQFPAAARSADGTALEVSWTITSITADTTLLERQDTDWHGTLIADWTEVARLKPSVLTYHDANVVENRSYSYRISSLKTGIASQAVISPVAGIPLKAPIGLEVDPVVGGFHLSWQNQSLVAPQVLILRGPSETAHGAPVAALPATAAAYDDLNLPIGYYTYRLAASNDGRTYISVSDPVTVLINPPGQLALIATPFSPTWTASAAFLRPQQGDWVFVDLNSGSVLGTTDWPVYLLDKGSWWDRPFLRFDGQGLPHGLCQSSAGSSNTHFWFDGTSWLTETFASPVFNNPSYSPPGTAFCLDAAGNPHVLLDHTSDTYDHGGSTASLNYAHKVNGAWVLEPLTGIQPQLDEIFHYQISVTASGAVHALLQGADWSAECTRRPEGGWTTTSLPLGDFYNPYVQEYDYLRATWIDDDNAWILYWNEFASQAGFRVMQKVAGVWQSSVQVAPTFKEYTVPTALVISPDQTRLAFATNTQRGLKVVDHTAAGWRESLLSPQIGTSYHDWWSTIGFDAQNHLHLLTWNAQTGYVDYHE